MLLAYRPEAQKDNDAGRLASVLRLQCIWRRVNRKLCSGSDRQVRNHEIAVEPERIRLHPSNDRFVEIGRKRDVPK